MQERENLEKRIGKRERLVKGRLSRTDREVSSTIEERRYKVDRKERKKYIEKRRDEGVSVASAPNAANEAEKILHGRSGSKERELKKHIYGRRFKLLDILYRCEERYPYDIWERIYVRRECIEDEEGYRVKANQKRIKEWVIAIVTKYEEELRGVREQGNRKVKYNPESRKDRRRGTIRTVRKEGSQKERTGEGLVTLRMQQSQQKHEDQNIELRKSRFVHNAEKNQRLAKLNSEKEEGKQVDERSERGFWKYYLEEEAKLVGFWKKGVLYKKSIRTDELTSWDLQTYGKEWYDRRRTIQMRRRYVRPPVPWKVAALLRKSTQRILKVTQKRGPVYRQGRKVDSYRKYEKSNESDKRNQERAKIADSIKRRTYNAYQNPENREREEREGEQRRNRLYFDKSQDFERSNLHKMNNEYVGYRGDPRSRKEDMWGLRMKNRECEYFTKFHKRDYPSGFETYEKWSSQLVRLRSKTDQEYFNKKYQSEGSVETKKKTKRTIRWKRK
jgi:hypothetical protein